MSKKIISIIIAVFLMVFLVACGGGAPEDDGKITIGFTCNNAANDANQATHFKAIQDACDAAGVELIALDPVGDANVQYSHIENFIEMGVDGIIFRAVDSTTIIPALQKAHDLGIPIVCTTNIIDESGFDYFDAFCGPSDYNQAVEAAGIAMNLFPDKETVNVLQVQHVPGSTVSQFRDQGFWEAAEGSNLVLLEKQTANGKREEAQQITENWLLKYDISEIDVIYIEGDGMLHGVTAAMEAAGVTGEDIAVIGIAVSAETYDKIESGLVAGSVLQSPYDDAKLAVETIIKLINGESVEFLTYMANPAVTKETLDEIPRPDW